MTQATTAREPGSMTVPPLFGWETIATVLVVVAVVAVVTVVLLQAGKDTGGRSEWQAWLDGRSAALRQPAADDGPVAESDTGPGRPSGGPSVVVRRRAAWRSPRS